MFPSGERLLISYKELLFRPFGLISRDTHPETVPAPIEMQEVSFSKSHNLVRGLFRACSVEADAFEIQSFLEKLECVLVARLGKDQPLAAVVVGPVMLDLRFASQGLVKPPHSLLAGVAVAAAGVSHFESNLLGSDLDPARILPVVDLNPAAFDLTLVARLNGFCFHIECPNHLSRVIPGRELIGCVGCGGESTAQADSFPQPKLFSRCFQFRPCGLISEDSSSNWSLHRSRCRLKVLVSLSTCEAGQVEFHQLIRELRIEMRLTLSVSPAGRTSLREVLRFWAFHLEPASGTDLYGVWQPLKGAANLTASFPGLAALFEELVGPIFPFLVERYLLW